MKRSDPALQQQLRQCICYGITALAVIAISLVMYFCIERISGLRSFGRGMVAALMPVIVGVVIAYLLSPLYNLAHRRLFPLLQGRLGERFARFWAKSLSIFFSLLVLVLALYALLAMIVPQLMDSLGTLAKNVPQYIVQIREGLKVLLEDYPELQTVVINLFNNATTYVQSWVTTNLEGEGLSELFTNAWGVVSNISTGLKNALIFLKHVVIGVIIAVYILAAKQRMSGHAKRLLYTIFPRRVGNIILENCRFAHRALSGFIFGKLLDSLIIGLLCFIGCSALSIPYALLVSVIIGVTNIVPFFGPFIGAIPCGIFILIVDPMRCLVFVILILVLQQLDGNILGPKILGDSTGLSPFWVIFSLLLFGSLFGFVGMLVGCPIWAVICHIVDEIIEYRLRQRGLSVRAEDYELLERIEDGSYHKIPDPALESDPEKKRSPLRRKKAPPEEGDDGGETGAAS